VNGPTAPPVGGNQGNEPPVLVGIFEDWYFLEMYMHRNVIATPMTEEGWLVGAIKRKALKKETASEALMYGYDKTTGLMVFPNVLRVTLQRQMTPNPQNPQGPPIPQVAVAVRNVKETTVALAGVAYSHELLPGGHDFADMVIGLIQQSMSKIERVAGMPPGAQIVKP